MFGEHISTEVMLFFILYGVTGVVPLIAAVYLLLRRGNAFAPGVTPPVRLRRWAAAFFAVLPLPRRPLLPNSWPMTAAIAVTAPSVSPSNSAWGSL